MAGFQIFYCILGAASPENYVTIFTKISRIDTVVYILASVSIVSGVVIYIQAKKLRGAAM